MLEILQTGKALYALAAIGIIGVLSKLVTRSLYKRLIRETDNMAATKNKNLKILKQKLENACRLNQTIVNTQAYLERQMYGFRFMKVSLQGWNNVSLQMTILGILAGGAASFASYWYRLDSYYIVLYASAGAFLGLFLAFLESSFNIGLKQQRLANALLEYTDNSVFVRAARENGGRDERFQDNVRRLPVREIGTERGDDRELMLRENELRDGLIRDAVKASAQTRGQAQQDRRSGLGDKRGDKPAGLKRLKAEKMVKAKKGAAPAGEDSFSAFDTAQASPIGGMEAGTAERGEAPADASRKEQAGRLGAVRDIDYLKHSLEQIAASREKTKREEDWTKELDPDEMKVLGELIRQYFSVD